MKGWMNQFPTQVTLCGINFHIIFATTNDSKTIALIVPANKKLMPSLLGFVSTSLQTSQIEDFEILINQFGSYMSQIQAYRLIEEEANC